MFRYDCGDCIVDKAFPSPCGVWDRPNSYDEKFPSPCGVWVVSMWPTKLLGRCDLVSVPLRGVGCFEADRMEIQGEKLMFPSPCGVWVVSNHS